MADELDGTPIEKKFEILADLWINYRNEEDFQEFVEYNDLGLPLAYATHEGIIEITEESAKFIEETFAILLAGLELEDTGYENLEEILGE